MPVLLALGCAILVTGFYTHCPEPQASRYYQSSTEAEQPNLIRATQEAHLSITGNYFIEVTTDLSCAETPPELAMFFNLPLPINRADSSTLVTLPGIGVGLAAKIISYRKRQGRINGLKELAQINGIGTKLTEQLAPLICYE